MLSTSKVAATARENFPSFGMTSQEWATLQPVSEKRGNHKVCLQGDRIIVAGGRNRSEYRDTCEATDTKPKRFV